MRRNFRFLGVTALLFALANSAPPHFARAQADLIPPQDLRVIDSGLRKITLAWSPSTDPQVGGYVIYRQAPKEGSFKKVATVHGWQSDRYTDDGKLFGRLQDGTQYLYSIAAYADGGRISLPSNSVRASTAGAPTPILELVGISGPRQVRLQWRVSPELEVSSYRIWRARHRDDEYARVGTRYRRDEPSFVDKGLEDLAEYFYMVTAVNAAGVESEACQPILVRTSAPPMSPLGLEAGSNANGRVALRWNQNPEPNLSHYEVLRSTKADRGYKLLEKAPARQTQYVDLEVDVGTLYFYSLVAVNLEGLRSQPSPPVRGFTSVPPLTPSGLQASPSSGGVLLEWTRSDDPNVIGYLVYEKKYYSWNRVGRTAESTFFASIPDTDAPRKFRVSAFLANGLESKPSEAIRVDARTPAGVPDDVASTQP